MTGTNLTPGDVVEIYGQRFVLNSFVIDKNKKPRVTFVRESEIENPFEEKEN